MNKKKIVDFRKFWRQCKNFDFDSVYRTGYNVCKETGNECDMEFDYDKDRGRCPEGRPATLQEIFDFDPAEGAKWKAMIAKNNNEEIPADKDCDAHLWSSFECPWFVIERGGKIVS